ncbi:uncharacterized protein LOC135961648 [Calliphora vicina]|uniref:uncharacterized protein LOC135961648 n=1 Tax=Calliphora vicina TaxID=7373 RepID=UPI00325BCE97
MDLNTKIIKGVRQFPSLYDNKGNLEERNQAWMKLADKLKMHEVNLKIRWHSLVQGYQRNTNFKYANDMRFVQRITEEDSWPEFIITEDDLKDAKPEREREEFVFLELVEEENKTKDLPQESAKEKESHYKEKPKQLEEISSPEIQNKHKSDSKIIVQKIEPSNKTLNEVLDETVTDKAEESAIATTSKVEKKMAVVDVNKIEEPCIKESKELKIEKAQPVPIERCEDAIFGELVSAMLKRMEENKKKNIKKEIMNLLFS